MKVLGLVSGGKDSVYNLILCQNYGHKVVALANLHPADGSVDELDSYMYQTVGHQLVEAYALCARLPLFRRRIRGSSTLKSGHRKVASGFKQASVVATELRQTPLTHILQDMNYTTTPGDEVEDLHSLVAFAKQRLPGIEAVSSGAIASDYQRLRVEHVCGRLGLVSLAFLWMRPQRQLLEEMIEVGVEAVLVKVAALGLDPRRHLGKTLPHMLPVLDKLNRDFGCNVCGEGGEYETLTLDCPLFGGGRIILDAWEIRLHSEDSFASVGVLHPTAFHVEPRDSPASSSAFIIDEGCGTDVVDVPDEFVAPPVSAAAGGNVASDACPTVVRSGGGHGLLGAWCCPVLDSHQDHQEALASALLSALLAIAQDLDERESGLEEALLVQLWLRDITLFGPANEVYQRVFPRARPAARACVEAALPSDSPVAVQVVAGKRGSQRRVLHVQSISCWAPSCIGPYSQAVASGGLLFFAGQIGLRPQTMELLSGVQQQTHRCIASCQAVAVAMGADLPSNIVAATLFSAPKAGRSGRHLLDEGLAAFMSRAGRDLEGEGREHVADSYLRARAQPRSWQPVIAHVVVPALPRGAAVEIQPLACLRPEGAAEASDSSDPSGSQRDWTHRLRSETLSRGQILASTLISPGHFCRCNIFWERPAEAIEPCSSGGSAAVGRQAGADSAAQDLVAVLGDTLAAAELGADDVIGSTMYVSRGLGAERDGAQTASEPEREVREALRAAGFHGMAAAIVPVLAVGPSPEASSALMIEVLCVRTSS